MACHNSTTWLATIQQHGLPRFNNMVCHNSTIWLAMIRQHGLPRINKMACHDSTTWFAMIDSTTWLAKIQQHSLLQHYGFLDLKCHFVEHFYYTRKCCIHSGIEC
ncbi:unnamed protein product [Owenia fusiformis]|uniref:Uncharacterized protein n=1 Tax=Owenia fusiformis TaxID=6347 RepID=A0A8J1XSE0_OWEFU|nr:unnamed protein product [Owenia fusiformis]